MAAESPISVNFLNNLKLNSEIFTELIMDPRFFRSHSNQRFLLQISKLRTWLHSNQLFLLQISKQKKILGFCGCIINAEFFITARAKNYAKKTKSALCPL